MKRKFILILLVAILGFLGLTHSCQASLSCQVKVGGCDPGEISVFKMSSTTDAHAELPTETNYNVNVCCTGVTGLGNSCSGDHDTVLKLAAPTDAHVEEKTLNNYDNPVCLSVDNGTVNCDYASDCSNLGAGYSCLASIASATNAHVGDCNSYPIKVCCKVSHALYCRIEPDSCGTDETLVFKMSSTTNAHAELASSTNYSNFLCCGGIDGLGNSCSGNYDTVLKLSSSTNAHVEEKTQTNYSQSVCLSTLTGTINCGYADDCATLGSDYACLVSISSSTNAHVGNCSAYPTEVCCEKVNQPPKAENLQVDESYLCGYNLARLKFTWDFDPSGGNQKAYRLEVSTSSDFSNVILRSCDSNPPTDPSARCETGSNSFINQPPPYPLLSWNTDYYWQVKVWDEDNLESEWTTSTYKTPKHSYPVVKFIPSTFYPTLDEIVTFYDQSSCYPGGAEQTCSSTGANFSYSWDFGNGETSDTKGDATTTYTTTGLKEVILRITDNTFSPPATCEYRRILNVRRRLPWWREIIPF